MFVCDLIFRFFLRELGWRWIVAFDGFNTILKCFPAQLLPNQSWYLAKTLFPSPKAVSAGLNGTHATGGVHIRFLEALTRRRALYVAK